MSRENRASRSRRIRWYLRVYAFLPALLVAVLCVRSYFVVDSTDIQSKTVNDTAGNERTAPSMSDLPYTSVTLRQRYWLGESACGSLYLQFGSIQCSFDGDARLTRQRLN